MLLADRGRRMQKASPGGLTKATATFSGSARLQLRIQQTQGDGGSALHELPQAPRAYHVARAKYEKPVRARSDLEMVRKPTEVPQFVAGKEFALPGIVRAAQQKSSCEVGFRIALDWVGLQSIVAPIQDVFRANLESR